MSHRPLRNVFLAAATAVVVVGVPSTASAALLTTSGTVTSSPVVPEILTQTFNDGTVVHCEAWAGAIRTSAGITMTVMVETPMSGSLTSGGLHPTDPGAVRIDKTLTQAAADGSRAVVSISYNPSEIDCGDQFINVVKSVSLPAPNTTLNHARIDSQRHSATFTFKATGDVAGFQCALVKLRNGTPHKPTLHYHVCASPKHYTHLTQGSYIFYVRAVTRAYLDLLGLGGTDQTPATHDFTIG
jgi:hypothetical protein